MQRLDSILLVSAKTGFKTQRAALRKAGHTSSAIATQPAKAAQPSILRKRPASADVIANTAEAPSIAKKRRRLIGKQPAPEH